MDMNPFDAERLELVSGQNLTPMRPRCRAATKDKTLFAICIYGQPDIWPSVPIREWPWVRGSVYDGPNMS